MGSGGTAAGLAAGRLLTGRQSPRLWAVNVCDDAPTFASTLGEIFEELNSRFRLGFDPNDTGVGILDGYVGDGYAIPYPEELELIAACARLEGQVLDPVYTGKALYGLQQEIRSGRFTQNENVIFVHTGGVFGIYPQRADLAGHLALPCRTDS
jgi:D-cysteine desulfhydrase